MKITNITLNRVFAEDKTKCETMNVNITYDMLTEDIKDDALYYLICAIQKSDYNNYNNLDLMTKMQVDARIDRCIELLNKLK